MVKVKSRTRKVEPRKEKDVNVKIFNKQVYFKNAYHLTSLINDIFLGLLYFTGSLANILNFPPYVGQILYLLGGMLFVARPIINILHNVKMEDREDIDKSKGEDASDPDKKTFDYEEGSEEETSEEEDED